MKNRIFTQGAMPNQMMEGGNNLMLEPIQAGLFRLSGTGAEPEGNEVGNGHGTPPDNTGTSRRSYAPGNLDGTRRKGTHGNEVGNGWGSAESA
jgi:hypothetical protein